MSDPASLNVGVSLAGLGQDETLCVIVNAPAGSTLTVEVGQPALGPKRYSIAAAGLSITGARDITATLLAYLRMEHLKRIADGDAASDAAPVPDA